MLYLRCSAIGAWAVPLPYFFTSSFAARLSPYLISSSRQNNQNTHLEVVHLLGAHHFRNKIRLNLLERKSEPLVRVVFFVGLVLRDVSTAGIHPVKVAHLVIQDQGKVRVFRRWIQDERDQGVDRRLFRDKMERPALLVLELSYQLRSPALQEDYKADLNQSIVVLDNLVAKVLGLGEELLETDPLSGHLIAVFPQHLACVGDSAVLTIGIDKLVVIYASFHQLITLSSSDV